MKKIFAGLLFILALCLLGTALAFHDHVDLDGAPTLPSGYRAPTETEDGYSGDLICPACGETITIDDGILDDGAITCPSCGKELEFDLELDDDEADE